MLRMTRGIAPETRKQNPNPLPMDPPLPTPRGSGSGIELTPPPPRDVSERPYTVGGGGYPLPPPSSPSNVGG